MTTSRPASPPKCVAPVPLRAFQPAYASWTTAASDVSSSVGDKLNASQHGPPGEKRRLALQAPTSTLALLNILHRMTGHRLPEGHELFTPEAGSFVRVVGWREVSSRTGGAHLAYTILAAAPSAVHQYPHAEGMPPPASEARLVMRRYRDFVKLHATLSPHARQAGLTLPPLPSRITAIGRKLSPEVGAQRQRALHDWLNRV